MKIRIAALFYVLLFALSLWSCTGDGQDADSDTGTESVTEAVTTDSLLHDDVPELDFGGYEYRVLLGTYDRANVELYPEEGTGDVLNDAIFNRNKKIEERFNVVFSANTIDLFQLLATLRKDVLAGADAYDMYMQIDRDAYTAATEHLLYPVDTLPHIDLSKPYWGPTNKGLSLKGKLYFAFSDEMLSHFEATTLLYFNKKQANDLNIGSLYDLVRSGGWTYDKFFEYAQKAIMDIDGDSSITVADNWGIASEHDYLFANFWICAGVNTVEKNSDDIPYFSVPGNEKFFAIAEKVISVIDNTKSGIYIDSNTVNLPAGRGTPARVEYFKSGHSLFSSGAIAEMALLRDMPDDFGVIPFPKYNEEQDRYYTRVCGGFPFVTPTTITSPEIAGALMEAMACETHNSVIPAYYETSLKDKFSRDPDTTEMLDLIFNTHVYDLGDTIWYAAIRLPYTMEFVKGDNTFVSFTEKNEKSINSIIEKAVEQILESEA